VGQDAGVKGMSIQTIGGNVDKYSTIKISMETTQESKNRNMI
jgi:hypothetical protein